MNEIALFCVLYPSMELIKYKFRLMGVRKCLLFSLFGDDRSLCFYALTSVGAFLFSEEKNNGCCIFKGNKFQSKATIGRPRASTDSTDLVSDW